MGSSTIEPFNKLNYYNMTYITKDSGERKQYESGFQRDVPTGKPRYDLIPPSSLKRLAEVYMRGAEKYNDNNWKLATSDDEHQRFIASAFRHFEQWRNGERDEDHAYQAIWNIIAYEWHMDKIKQDEEMLTRDCSVCLANIKHGSVIYKSGQCPHHTVNNITKNQ